MDADGAITETLSRLPAQSRRAFLGAALAGAGALVAGLSPAPAAAKGQDVAILNYALALEYLQAAFYSEAERRGALRGVPARAARVVGAVERAHVRALRAALGSAAIARPFFDFQGTTEDGDAFLRTAVAFEDLATAAYKAELPRLGAREVVAAAAAIHTVEARHAAWMRFLAGVDPAGDALDEPLSRRRTLGIVRSTGFVRARPTTASRRPPSFTG